MKKATIPEEKRSQSHGQITTGTSARAPSKIARILAHLLNAGNLLDAARRLQRQHPDAVPIVAGDDDHQTPGNPGKTAAINAAATLGCGLVLPPWSGAEPLTLTDFNDLANWRAAQ